MMSPYFRRRIGAVKFPQLWRGCRGAWCPKITGHTGPVLYGQTVNQLHASLQGTGPGAPSSWAVNRDGYCLNVDGTQLSHGDVGSPAALNLPGSMSVSAWINTTYTSIHHVVGTANSAGTRIQWVLELNRTAEKLGLRWSNEAAGSYATLASSGSVATGSWQHIGASRYGSSGAWNVDFYINGVLDSSTSSAVDPATTMDSMCLAALGAYAFQRFTGYLDDVRIYDRPLSTGEWRLLGRNRGIAYEVLTHRAQLNRQDVPVTGLVKGIVGGGVGYIL